MQFENPSDVEIRAILSKPTTVAVVGCSDNLSRDSLKIAILLKSHGFRVIPVNPALKRDALLEALEERVYPHLASIPVPVEIVDVAAFAGERSQRMHAAAGRAGKFLDQAARLLLGHREHQVCRFEQFRMTLEIGRGELFADMNTVVAQHQPRIHRY